jgi:hypothetical protein
VVEGSKKRRKQERLVEDLRALLRKGIIVGCGSEDELKNSLRACVEQWRERYFYLTVVCIMTPESE